MAEKEQASRTSDTGSHPSASLTSQTAATRAPKPQLRSNDSSLQPSRHVNFADESRSPTFASFANQLSPDVQDRVFPIRSVVSVDPNQTPSVRTEQDAAGYFPSAAYARRQVSHGRDGAGVQTPKEARLASEDQNKAQNAYSDQSGSDREGPGSTSTGARSSLGRPPTPKRHESQYLQGVMAETGSVSSGTGGRSYPTSDRPTSQRAASIGSVRDEDIGSGLVTARFKHVTSEEGHAVITGRDGETLQRCEDEPISFPGAVQGFGLLMALEEQQEGKLLVRIVSENSKRLIGYTPRQLFALESFTDILSEDQADNLLDHVDFIRDEGTDVIANGPEVFTMTIRNPQRKSAKLWCAMHINERHPNLLICEFELEDDQYHPLVPPNDTTPEPPEDTLDSRPTEEEYEESTYNISKPLRVLRSARKRKGDAAAMEVFNIMSQVQEQLAAAPNLDKFLKILVGVVKELSGFHRVMVYQFDQQWNGRVVTELVDPRATKDLYKGLNFPASDIPRQARDLYKINKVRMLYDRDQETARLVCRTIEDLETPLDLTHSYLRAMSPIHIKYLANMAVRSSMSISINAFDELWGLIACHTYGSKGMRVSFPIRKMCRLVGDSASRNIERLSYAARLQARKLINTVPTQSNPSGYIIASSEDLLKLFDADFGLLAIRGETKILGHLEQSQEALAMLEYLRMRSITNVMTSQDIRQDFPDLRYEPGFSVIAGLLLVPLSVGGQDFIVFFRKGQLKEVKWAGNPYEKFIKEGTEGYLEPRKSFRTWSEMVVGKCREWTEEQIETAAVLCLVYGKFIEVWRQKEAALQNSQLTRLLLANSAHEVRTPLNAIINYLEIAMEGSLDQETRDNLAKSHSASKSLIYVINDLLDLTQTEEGGDLIKDEIFELNGMLAEATDMFKNDAQRKSIDYEVECVPGLPATVIGDHRRVRQAISNITANAIQNTTKGSVRVEMSLTSREESRCEIEVTVTDTGIGMNDSKLDQLFRELEQVQTESGGSLEEKVMPSQKALPDAAQSSEQRALGLGLAVVARIIKNMNGQLRLKSEEGKGSRFVMVLPFEIPETEPKPKAIEDGSIASVSQLEENGMLSQSTVPGEVTLIERGSLSASKRPSAADIAQGSPRILSRENSMDSVNSKRSVASIRSLRSNVSASSNRSGASEADRLIEAIQEPHRVDGWHKDSAQRSGAGHPRLQGTAKGANGHPANRPRLEKRHTHGFEPVEGPTGSPRRKLNRPKSVDVDFATSELQMAQPTQAKPGESLVMDQGQPIRPVRVPEFGPMTPTSGSPGKRVVSNPGCVLENKGPSSPKAVESTSAEHMRVLVAEDDIVNSRIISTRLKKLGHEVLVTVNGEDCSAAYCDRCSHWDCVLMDQQMPIVDGLASTKMIRSYEKTSASSQLSSRAALNGRVPIIAVSASLIEKDREIYTNAGVDGWILKPINFARLSELMKGIVDPEIRRKNLYSKGQWERGGWFAEGHKTDVFDADTRPSEQPPLCAPGPAAGPSEGVKIAAATEDPFVKEDSGSRQTEEQNRMAAEQERKMPDEGSREAGIGTEKEASSEETITPQSAMSGSATSTETKPVVEQSGSEGGS